MTNSLDIIHTQLEATILPNRIGIGNPSLELVDSVSQASKFWSWLSERRLILAFDTETGGLDPERDPLRLVQFGDTESGWAIPWDRWGGVAIEAIQAYEGPMVGHNAKFDVRFIERHSGIRMPRERIHDSRLMCHIINPIGSTALKPNAAKRVDAKAAYASKMLDAAMDEQGWTWATVPVEFHLYWMYGALDTVLTAHLFEKLGPEITSRYAEVYNLEQQVQWILADMETHGARIDHDYTTKKSYELEMYGQDVENWCKATYGISPGQNQEVAKVLESLGIPMNIRTPTGSFKLDEDVIMSIIGGEYENVDPNSLNEGQMLAYRVLSRRKSEKIKSTYLDTFLEVTDARGYVHPRINQLGARTGRMSMERPALQTLPRGRVVRDCFIPSDGNSLLTADFDGIEMRCLAHYAQDSALIDAINSGDIHLAMAKLAYQDDTITKKDPRRQIAKSVNFAKIYGAGTEKVALTAGISYEEAKDFLAKYDAMFPGIKEFQNAVGKEVARRKRDEGVAYVHTPLGRIQKTDDDRDYALVNSLIQGMAADVFKEALVRLGESPVAEFMVLPVHDEVVFDIPNEFIEESKIIITKAMADDRWAVPFTVGIEGPLDRWGAKYA